MTEPDPKLPLDDPNDLSDTISFALRFEGKKRYHDSDRFAADIVADRLVRHLDRAGYVVMKKPPLTGHGQNWKKDEMGASPAREGTGRVTSPWAQRRQMPPSPP
jgi:hypothetical protein